ncbi:high mobility group box domain-containing protein, partial [Crucibulum laeve]
MQHLPPTPLARTHGKKRDASYIPRPPNAFILFRSSFIKSQQVPGKVEGNHSTLSKIIGMYWRSLSDAERQSWEDKAKLAQIEHRRRYPDWRFRP